MRYHGHMRLMVLLTLVSSLACSKQDSQPDPGAPTEEPNSPSESTDATAPSNGANAAVGQPAPDFELTGLDGAKAKLSDHRGKIVVLEWFNPDCPYVKNAHRIGSLKGLAAKVTGANADVVWLAINSGAAGRQGHGDETNRKGKQAFGIDYPILFDADGAVGKKYGATNTPHMYVIDKEGKLVYAGALDNTRSGDPEDAEGGLTNYVENAIADVAGGKPVRKANTEAWGCSVKYAN